MSRTSQNILFLREQGLTQVEIAKRSGVPQCRLSRWENGNAPRSADDALKLEDLVRLIRAESQAQAAINSESRQQAQEGAHA